MPKLDLHAAIRNAIAAQVEAALEPHRELLNSLEQLVREQQRAAGQSAPSATRKPVARRGGRRGARNVAVATNTFTVGQLVSYRQGRGTFEAKVKEVDTEKAELVLERVGDGKRVERPFDKVAVAG